MIPAYIEEIISRLNAQGFEAYVVGGSVRDLLMGKTPKDWDITTNARPENILEIFPDSVYENSFGTVIVKKKNEAGQTTEIAEVTTYRSESNYSDHRRPDTVVFEDRLEADLSRRDFTVNAMALTPVTDSGGMQLGEGESIIELDGEAYKIIDFYGGQKDIHKRVIRAVGEPNIRFKEDALRMMRAVRFACQLGFDIEPKTERGIIKLAGSLKFIANERIKDELIKILETDKRAFGFDKLHDLNLLNYIIPELETGFNMKQNHHHIYTVFEHSLRSLQCVPSKEWQVRLAALLHDVGKPAARKIIDGQTTFYNHEYIGAKMTKKIMSRLKFPTADIERVVNLVRNHMFYYNVDEVTAASVRRLIAKTGRENLKDLIDLRVADRLGSGTPKAMPYKLRHLQYMFEKVQNDPVSVKMLAINGDNLINDLKLEPSPKFGCLLDCLLAEVLDNPDYNTKDYLLKRAEELLKEDLETLRTKAKGVIEEKQEDEDQLIKKQYKV
ncbi:MAG: CCA tRNA nucleotidyltransferase [Patescibacteria group bacterium]|nr:CCA tRNA nucleotidyltransferase [Patescibacteria group bacterium]